MNEATTIARVNAILTTNLGLEPGKVTPGIRLIPADHGGHHWSSSGGGSDDLGADSLDVVELVMAFEEEFRIEITDDEGDRLNTGTVQDVYDLIEAKLAA